MVPLPTWIPAAIELDGNWEITLRKLYAVFCRDFKLSGLKCRGMPVWYDRGIQVGDKYENGFWHLISRVDSRTRLRCPDFARAAKLPWVAAILQNAADPAVSVWVNSESSGKLRTYLWLEQGDFVLVLEKKSIQSSRGAHCALFLVTAYCSDGDSSRRKLRRQRDEWGRKMQPPPF